MPKKLECFQFHFLYWNNPYHLKHYIKSRKFHCFQLVVMYSKQILLHFHQSFLFLVISKKSLAFQQIVCPAYIHINWNILSK